ASAPAADCTSSGSMMSCTSTWRMLSPHADVTSARPATSAAARHALDRAEPGERLSFSLVLVIVLESEGETEREVRRRSKRLELGRRVARRPERLRVDARVLGPEDTEVAHGRRRHEAAAAEDAHGQVLGEPVRQRELTPADEVTLLEEPAEDARAE